MSPLADGEEAVHSTSHCGVVVPFCLVVLVLTACSDSAENGSDTTLASTTTTTATTTTLPPTTTRTTTPPTTTVDPGVALEPEVLAAVEELAAARDASDVEQVMGVVQTSLSEAEHRRFAFFAAWPTERTISCEVDSVTDVVGTVTCNTESFGPVYPAMDPSAGIVQYSIWPDGITWNGMGGPGVQGPMDDAHALAAYSDYLRQFVPDECASVCDRAAYDSAQVRYEYGIALVQACGELLASASESIGEWIADDDIVERIKGAESESRAERWTLELACA